MQIRIVRIIVYFTLSIIIVCSIIPVSASADSSNIREIDIMTTPEKVFFDLRNIKPGDWSTKTIKIINSGRQDFSYSVSAERNIGSKKLYQSLQLVINDKNNNEIYRGSLGDFSKLDGRQLMSNESEELEFTIKFPEEHGNEYQGLTTEVDLKFYAEGTLGEVLPSDGPKLPATATNQFNLFMIGLVLLTGGILLFLAKKKLVEKRGS